MTTVDQLHIYVAPDLKHRWSYVAANGPILGDSGQGYRDIRDCRRGFSIVNRRTLSTMPLYQLDRCDKHNGHRCLVWQILRRPEEPTKVAHIANRSTDGGFSCSCGHRDPTACPYEPIRSSP